MQTYPKELVGLRGLAAAYVLLHHLLIMLPTGGIGVSLLANGYGVKLFMIVSGFSIYWRLDTRKSTYGRFIVRRAFRIFPVYLVGLIASTLMLLAGIGEKLSDIAQLPAHLAAHAALLHGLVPDSLLPAACCAVIAQAWSLSVEWQFYLVAPLAVGWISTLDRRTSQVCLIGLCGGLLLSGAHLSIAFLGNNLAMIALGVLSYVLIKRCREHGDDRSASAGMAAVLAIAVIEDVGALPSVLVWVVTIYAATAGQRGRIADFVSGALRSRLAQYLGRISFSIYIFHLVALYLCLHAVNRVSLRGSWRDIAFVWATTVLTIVFAEFATRFIERPFYRLGRALTDDPRCIHQVPQIVFRRVARATNLGLADPSPSAASGLSVQRYDSLAGVG